MKKNQTHYYKVICKCGHLGRKKYIPISFPVKATSGKEAAAIARYFPRVKHEHKDAILMVKEMSYSEYLELIEINNNDPYLHCHSRREQNEICDLTARWINDPNYKDTKIIKAKKREHRAERVAYIRKRERITLDLLGGYENVDLY